MTQTNKTGESDRHKGFFLISRKTKHDTGFSWKSSVCVCVGDLVGEYVNERAEREVGRRRVCSSGKRGEGATFYLH